MNLTPINPYHLIQNLTAQVKALSEANAEIMQSIYSAEITEVTKNGILMDASIPADDENSYSVEIKISMKGKGNLKVLQTIAERLQFLKEFAIQTMRGLNDDSMD